MSMLTSVFCNVYFWKKSCDRHRIISVSTRGCVFSRRVEGSSRMNKWPWCCSTWCSSRFVRPSCRTRRALDHRKQRPATPWTETHSSTTSTQLSVRCVSGAGRTDEPSCHHICSVCRSSRKCSWTTGETQAGRPVDSSPPHDARRPLYAWSCTWPAQSD